MLFTHPSTRQQPLDLHIHPIVVHVEGSVSLKIYLTGHVCIKISTPTRKQNGPLLVGPRAGRPLSAYLLGHRGVYPMSPNTARGVQGPADPKIACLSYIQREEGGRDTRREEKRSEATSSRAPLLKLSSSPSLMAFGQDSKC